MGLINRLVNVFHKDRLRGQIDEELEFHLAARARDNIAAGMKPEEAREAARRRFGARRSQPSPRISLSGDVEANGYDTHRIIGLPGPGQPRREDVFAARRGDLQISACGSAETHAWIDRPLGRVLDSSDSFGEFQTPGVSGGGAAGNGQRDDFSVFSFYVQMFGQILSLATRREHGQAF